MFCYGRVVLKSLLLLPLAAALLSGCAVTTEGSLQAPMAERPDSVCIIRNPAVAIVQAPTIFQQSFQSRGVNAVVCESKQDCKSPWYMTYVLTRRWDLTPYLAMGHAELYQDGQLVSSVDFSGGWGVEFRQVRAHEAEARRNDRSSSRREDGMMLRRKLFKHPLSWERVKHFC